MYPDDIIYAPLKHKLLCPSCHGKGWNEGKPFPVPDYISPERVADWIMDQSQINCYDCAGSGDYEKYLERLVSHYGEV